MLPASSAKTNRRIRQSQWLFLPINRIRQKGSGNRTVAMTPRPFMMEFVSPP
jgi:hypothetical protein